MKPYETFLNQSVGLRELLDIYLELRLHFKELGFNIEDLERPPQYTEKMMRLYHLFGDKQKALFKQVKDYGFDIDWNEFVEFMQPLMNKIDEVTPLKDGNN